MTVSSDRRAVPERAGISFKRFRIGGTRPKLAPDLTLHHSADVNPRHWILSALLFVCANGYAAVPDDPAPPVADFAEPADGALTKVVVIPIKDQITEPILYIVRRGLKEAIDNDVKLVVLDMDTPGGAVNVTLEIMEALDRFDGRTITFVNDEAISAGAIIAAVTDDIYFSPRALMGAAEVVFGTGQDVGDSMKRKLNSYLSGKIEAFSAGQPRRSDVLRAMMDPDFEFRIGETVIKPAGELLTLTAARAMETYGEPPEPLLATGIATDLDALLEQHAPGGRFEIRRLEVTWSEEVAQYLTKLAPLLLAAGMVCLFIEFKTPGFGVFGILGGLLLATVFFGHNIAGLSGHEPVLLFALGLVLIAIEVFFFPGTIVFAVSGAVMMLAALVWSMADLWPNEPIEFSGDVFLAPVTSVGTGMVLAVVVMALLVRFLPRGWVWNRLVTQAAISGTAQGADTAAALSPDAVDELIGKTVIAATDLYPGGQVELDGHRYEAHLVMGLAERGDRLVVIDRTEFGLRVEKSES